MDLHHRNSYVVAMDDRGRKFPGRRVYHDRIEELWQYLAQFGDQPKRVVFEAISNSRWMHRLLRSDPTIEPVAVTPHKVRIIAETVSKTDKIDAGVLATLSRVDMLPRAWLPDEQIEDLREMTRFRARLVALRTRAKNRVNGVLVRRGLVRPYQDIFGTLGRQWLEQADLSPVMRLQVDQWLSLIDTYEQKIAVAEAKLYKELARQDRWKDDIELLRTIPAVGPVTSVTILAELGEYRRFRRRSAVSCYVGLVPRSRRSDRTGRYGRISKRGSPALRSVLVEVAINVRRKVPRYAALYDSVCHRKGVKKARVAVARQLLEDAWTILMKREPFRFMPVTTMGVGQPVQAVSLARAG
jgi:transposase